MEAAGALASLAPSPITVLGLVPLLALGITYFRYQQFDPESYVSDINAVSTNTSVYSYIKYVFLLYSFVFLLCLKSRNCIIFF